MQFAPQGHFTSLVYAELGTRHSGRDNCRFSVFTSQTTIALLPYRSTNTLPRCCIVIVAKHWPHAQLCLAALTYLANGGRFPWIFINKSILADKELAIMNVNDHPISAVNTNMLLNISWDGNEIC